MHNRYLKMSPSGKSRLSGFPEFLFVIMFLTVGVSLTAWSQTGEQTKRPSQAGAPPVQAALAPTLTLTEAIGEYEQSPQVKKAISSAEEASWKRVEQTGVFFPTISVNAQYLIAHQYVFTNISLPGSGALIIPNIIPTSTYGVTAQWLLFDGFANVERYQGSKALENAGKKDLDWARFAGQREVVIVYYRALAAMILENVSEQNVKTLEDHLREVELFKRNGATTKYDVLRVEVQSSEANAELLGTRDNVEISLLRLGEVLGHEADHRQLSGTLPVLQLDLIKNLPTIYTSGSASGSESETASGSASGDASRTAPSDASRASSVEERPDIQALQSRVNGLDKLAHAASKHLVPTVSIGAQYLRYNNLTDNISDWSSYRDSYSLGVQLGWNLFDGFASSAKDHEAVERKVQAEQSLAMTRIHARNDVEYWRRRYIYFSSVYGSRLSDVKKSTESVRLAREGRKVGIRTTTDTLDAELELFRARAGVVNAQIGSIEALINIELSTGRQLYTFN